MCNEPGRSSLKGRKMDATGSRRILVSEDGLVYTFKLREGLMWSDGQPLTAEDFRLSSCASWIQPLLPTLRMSSTPSRTARLTMLAKLPIPTRSVSRRQMSSPW